MKGFKFFSIFLLILQVAAAGCSSNMAQMPVIGRSRTLTVLAAVSLTESFNEIGKLFETQNSGVSVTLVYAGSQQLVQQIGQGADADVFASASLKYMQAAVQAKRVSEGASKTFVKNRLVVIYPKANPGGIIDLKDLTKPGLKVVLADKSVPAGQYALDFLDKANQNPGFDPFFKANVLKNVVSYEDNVKSVYTKVALGEADAGIVYVTDTTIGAADKVSRLDIPDMFSTIATYPIAPILDSKNADLADAFIAFVLSQEGQAILSRHGFIPVSISSDS